MNFIYRKKTKSNNTELVFIYDNKVGNMLRTVSATDRKSTRRLNEDSIIL